jgi:methionyl-tRNA formyltransferase
MRVLFIGTVAFSLVALDKLLDMRVDIVGVCTKKESEFNSDYADLTPLCKEHAIPYHYVEDINSSESIKWIQSQKPDIVFCFGWSSLLKKNLLSVAGMGVVGFHPTALPSNRGRHPLIWALVLGLEKSASTFFFMDEGADSGDILSQKEFEISYDDDASTLYDKVSEIALKQIEDFVPSLEANSYIRVPQNELASNTWRKRSKNDGTIDFRMSSRAIYNLVRGLSRPYAGAHLEYNDTEIKVWKVVEVESEDKNIEPGKVLSVQNNQITIKTDTKAIKIVEHEFQTLPKVGEYL